MGRAPLRRARPLPLETVGEVEAACFMCAVIRRQRAVSRAERVRFSQARTREKRPPSGSNALNAKDIDETIGTKNLSSNPCMCDGNFATCWLYVLQGLESQL